MDEKKEFNPQEVIQFLQQKGIRNYKCPICQGNNFSIQNEIATISITDKLNTVQLGNHVPSAIMVCKNCGNLQFFALGTMGLLGSKGGGKE